MLVLNGKSPLYSRLSTALHEFFTPHKLSQRKGTVATSPNPRYKRYVIRWDNNMRSFSHFLRLTQINREKKKMVWWIAPTSFAAVGTGLLLAAVLTSGSTATAVYILLSMDIGFSLLSILVQILLRRSFRAKHAQEDSKDEESGTGWWSYQNNRDDKSEPTGWTPYQQNKMKQTDEKLRPSSVTIIIIMVPSILFLLLLFLRLVVGEDHFQGDAKELDFGPLDGIEGAEPNIAFGENNMSAIWHVLQGTFAALLAFPATSRLLISMCCGRCDRIILGFTELGSAALTFYPGYYLILYFFKDDENFATSSYVSNAFEWASGFSMGMTAGFFLSALVQRNLLANGDTYESKHGKKRIMVCYGPIKILHIMFGTLMMFTLFASGVLLGTTWNTCIGDATDCVNYSTNKEAADLVVSLCVVVPTVILFAVVLREKFRAAR